jgi:antitoxin (DNA-binding transcriptional repressor) of toxin-antitoxin stability system
MIDESIMKRATVADLRNRFRRVSAWIENGENVEIIRRGKPFARLQPMRTAASSPAPKVDFAAQRRVIWGQRKFSRAEVLAMRAFELEGEEG